MLTTILIIDGDNYDGDDCGCDYDDYDYSNGCGYVIIHFSSIYDIAFTCAFLIIQWSSNTLTFVKGRGCFSLAPKPMLAWCVDTAM